MSESQAGNTPGAPDAQSRDATGAAGGSAAVRFGAWNAAIIRLGRAHRALTSQMMHEVGLRPDQAALLMYLWARGPSRQTELMAYFRRDSAATTRTVQRMETAGLLQRAPDHTDRRATLVSPTTAAEVLKPQLQAIWERLEALVQSHLTTEAASALLQPIQTLGNDLDSDSDKQDPTLTIRFP